MPSRLKCIACGREYAADAQVYQCTACGSLLDVDHDLAGHSGPALRATFDGRLGALEHPYRSGVWRYKELVYPDIPDELIASRPEGNTNLYHVPSLARWAGLEQLYLKHEGENPTGSFKDRGMTVGVSHARVLGVQRVACASTGNTSSSLASYAAWAGIEGIVFLQNQMIASGKVSQGIAYGARNLRIDADFDRNLALVREVSDALGIYVLNSVNPFRLEGQKTIMFELLQQLAWQPPDWIVVPGGNLGNSSAFGKALVEAHQVGLIDRLPRIAIIQAAGANPLYRYLESGGTEFRPVHARTIATAIKIGNPVNLMKAVRTLEWTHGVVEVVDDQQIMDAKARIDAQGIGCEPASACSLAGVQKLVAKGIIDPGETVVGILTGHLLKDPEATMAYHMGELDGIEPAYANPLIEVEGTVDAIRAIL
jgi:threonine synthase